MQGIVGLVSGGLGLASALMGSSAAESAADTQSQAARYAADLTNQRWQQTRNDLLPFIQGGYDSSNILRQLTGTNPGGNPLTAALTRQFTGADLESTPGYQFTRDQGLKSLYNGYAARGLGNSSAALRGAARYTTGLAQATYDKQLQNDLVQRQSIFNMLFPQSQQGAQSAGALANLGQQYQNSTNQLIGTAAASEAAGDVGSAKAWQNLLNPLAQYGLMYAVNPTLFQPQTADAIKNNAAAKNIFGF